MFVIWTVYIKTTDDLCLLSSSKLISSALLVSEHSVLSGNLHGGLIVTKMTEAVVLQSSSVSLPGLVWQQHRNRPTALRPWRHSGDKVLLAKWSATPARLQSVQTHPVVVRLNGNNVFPQQRTAVAQQRIFETSKRPVARHFRGNIILQDC